MKIDAGWYEDFTCFKECASSIGKDGNVQFGIFVNMNTQDCIWQVLKENQIIYESYDHVAAVNIFNESIK